MAVPVPTQDAAAIDFGDPVTTWAIGAQTNAPSGAPIYVVLTTEDPQSHANMVTVPSGFSLVIENGGTGNEPNILVYRKTSSGSESGSYTFELAVGRRGTIAAFWVSGSDESDPNPTNHAAGANSGFDTETDYVAPSVTTDRDDCLVLRFFHGRSSPGQQTHTLNSLTELWNAGHRGAGGHQTQATAGATGTNTCTSSTAQRWVAVTMAIQPDDEPTARLQPEVLTTLPVAGEDLSVQTPADQNDEIRIQPPADEGMFPDERTVLVIHSRDYLPASVITGKPTNSTALIEANDSEVTGASILVCLMPAGHDNAGADYVFDVDATHSAGMSLPRIVAYALRVRWVHPTVHLAATPVFEALGGSEPVGDPDGLVNFPAITPDATALKSLRLCLGSTRRTGEWTIDVNLTRVLPRTEEALHHAAGYEDRTDTTEAPLRTASHDNPLDSPNSFYGRIGLSLLLQGSPDFGRPGSPDHAGTEPVSWESMKLVATDNPGSTATDDIEVYRHTASMAGDPEANGTLVHTFSPDGTVVDSDGWAAETEYFIQFVAKNANGSTLGPEFTRTTWREAAHVLTDAQTLVVPMEVVEAGPVVEKEELHGSNVDEASWNYDHPADANYMLVMVYAFDPDELATITGLTYNGAAMSVPRADVSEVSSAGGYMIGAVAAMQDPPSGSNVLAVQTSGGSPVNFRWHVRSFSGLNIVLRSAFLGDDELFDGQSSVNPTTDETDRLYDAIAWRNSAIGIASIGAGQDPSLGDDAPTRMNSTTRISTGTDGTMTQTPDDVSPSNVALHHGVSVRSDGGVGNAMKSLRVDVGKAALNDSDLTTTPSLLVEVFDETPTLMGSATLDGLSLAEAGIEEIIGVSEILAPQTAEIHMTNTGRTVAVWRLLGGETAVAPPTLVSATINEAGTAILATFDRAMADPVGKHAEFSWRADTAAREFSAAALDADPSVIVLTIDGAAAQLDAEHDLSYTPGTVQSADGVALEAITQRPLLPVLVSAATDSAGTEIRATFNKAMADPVGEHGAFSFEEDGVGRTFSAAALDADTSVIVLTVNGAAVAHTVPVTLSYTPGTVAAADGEALAALTDEEVDNSVFAPPVVTSAFTSEDGTTVTYRHDKAMADPTGEHTAYTFREDAGTVRGYSAAALGADPKDIVLTVDGAPIVTGTTVDGTYTPGAVQSAEGEALAAFSNDPVANLVDSDLTITTVLLPTAVQGEAYSHTLEVEGGTAPYSWDIMLGGFPSGLSLTLSTGEISGTVGATAETKSAALRVTDSLGAQAVREFTIEVVDGAVALSADIVGPTSGIIDVDAADLEDGVTLPMVALQAAFDTDPLALSVEAIPYSGWDGTNVQGYAGPSVFASSRDVLIEYAEIIPASAFGGSPGELHPSAAGTTEEYEAPVQGIPVGALITEFTSVMARANAGDIAEAKLVDPIYLSPYGWTEFAGWDNTHDVDAEDYTTETDEKAIEVTGGKPLTVRVRLRGDASSSDAALAYIRIKYQLRVGA